MNNRDRVYKVKATDLEGPFVFVKCQYAELGKTYTYLAPKAARLRTGMQVTTVHAGSWATVTAVGPYVTLPPNNTVGWRVISAWRHAPAPPPAPSISISVPEGVEVEIKRYDPEG